MAFPEVERVVYEKSPLDEVRCEVRFPPILAIEAAAPASFQDRVRERFPYFELKSPVKLPPGVPPNVAEILERNLSLIDAKEFTFASEDRSLILSLSKERISLTARRYERWEAFRNELQRVVNSVADVYRPTFFTHTCVRYKNSIRRGSLGLTDVHWSELVRPWISGPIAAPEVAVSVEALQSRCVIALENNAGFVDATFGLGVHQPTNEQAFLIETHVYNDERKVKDDVLTRLDALHRHAGYFFRWSITDKLHQAMRPARI